MRFLGRERVDLGQGGGASLALAGLIVRALQTDGGLWVSWPKKTSGVATDLGFDAVQQVGLHAGLVDNKVCAIDATWSGLKLVVRLQNRRAGGQQDLTEGHRE